MSRFNFVGQNDGDIFNRYIRQAEVYGEQRVMAASGVADYNNQHAIFMPIFEAGFQDILDRSVSIVERIRSYPATGHPTRYWQQTKNPQNTTWGDVRTYTPTEADTDYGRVEKSAWIKCIQSKFTIPYFDKLVMDHQGVLPDLVAKDLADWERNMLRFVNDAIYYGTDTDLAAPTTNQYVGLFNQIKQTATVGASSTISDFIRTEAAKLAARTDVNSNPTAVFLNPVTLDIWEQEERALGNNIRVYDYDYKPGIKISRIPTQCGWLDVIPDKHVKLVENGANIEHKILLLNEEEIERRYIGSPFPMVFELPLQQSLSDERFALLFDCLIVKAPEAQMIITKSVPKV